MKRQKVLSFFSLRILWDTPHLVFLTAMLLCGALAGSCTGLRSGHSEGALLEQIAVQMVEQARIGDGNVWMLLARTLAGALAWQGAAILCGMLRGHSLLLSGLCAARGFLLSFAAGAFLSTLQLRGLLLALITGGVSAVVTVPCLLLTASACFLAGQDAPNNRKGYWYALARFQRDCTLHCIGLLRRDFAHSDAVFGRKNRALKILKNFFKKMKKSVDERGCMRYNKYRR